VNELSNIGKQLAVLAVAQVATEEMLAAQLRLRTFDEVKNNILSCSYWSDFIQVAKAGEVPADWLPGALGRVVLDWAKNGAHV
jgi:hypothetical protein